MTIWHMLKSSPGCDGGERSRRDLRFFAETGRRAPLSGARMMASLFEDLEQRDNEGSLRGHE
jgi:hypothetical protein